MGGRGQLFFYHDLRHCLLTANWQSPDTDSCLFKHNNASLFQLFSDACEICRQKGQLPLGLSLGTTPKKNKGWLAMLPCRERRTKIRIGGNHYAILDSRSLENVRIVCRL
jgi:hypothetical protein